MTIRSYTISSGSAYVRKRPALPSPEVLRTASVAVNYGSPMTSSTWRSTSVPPTTGYVRQSTPGPMYMTSLSRRRPMSTAASVTDMRSAGSRSSLTPLSASSGRRSMSTSILPGSRTHGTRLSVITDDETDIGHSSSWFRPVTLLSRYPTVNRMKTSQGFLEDIEEEEKIRREELTDLRQCASKAKDYLDRHRQLLDRFRQQPNGPSLGFNVRVTPLSSSSTSTSRDVKSSYRPSTTTYAPSPVSTVVSPARRKVRDILSRSRTGRRD